MVLDFFDEVYVINLKRRIDRRVEMQKELDHYGIPFTFFEAVDMPQNGAAGLYHTMIKLFQHALENRQNNIMVLEDDAHFIVPNPVEFIKEVLPQVPSDYSLFYLGLNLISRPIKMSENILKVTDCFSTHAVCYSRGAMEMCLNALQRGKERPYDIFIREEILPYGGCYCTYPMAATQRLSYSDIEKSEPKWGHLMMQSYNLHTRDLEFPIRAPQQYQERIYCGQGHVIDGMIIYLDPDKHHVQRPDLIGRVCDCGKFVYSESLCGCAHQKWEVEWRENTNA